MQGRWILLGIPWLALLECGPVVVPASTTPVNDCATATATAASCNALCPPPSPSASTSCQCTATLGGNACLSDVPFGEFVLVVDIPDGAESAPGAALTLRSTDITCAKSSSSSCGVAGVSACTPGTFSTKSCVQLPGGPETTLGGAYIATAPFASDVGLHFGPPSALTTLPVRATFIPQWTAPCEPAGCTPAVTPASAVNLPLPTLTATTFAATMSNAMNLFQVLSGSPGPSGSPSPIAWATTLPSGTYAESVAAVPPFDARIPPFSTQIQISPASAQLTQIRLYEPTSIQEPPIRVTVAGLDPSSGWTVYLEQYPALGFPIGFGSLQLAKLADAPTPIVSSRSSIVEGSATLFTAQTQSLKNLMIVVSPPPDSVGIPDLVQAYVSGLEAYPYPPIPPPVKVSGTVVSPSGAPVSANLHFVATDLYKEGCGIAEDLSYDVFAATTGASATFSVALPQGHYSVTIDPTDPSSGMAKSIAQEQYPSAGAECPATAEIHRNLSATPLVPVTGNVAVLHGPPLANATVSFTPGALLLTEAAAPGAEDWPRSFEFTTDSNGNFSAQIDPGLYDITVQPVEGSRFPWIVDTTLTFPPPNNAKPLNLSVPAPALLSLTILDSPPTPVQQALVRAYAFVPCTPAVATGMTTEPCNDVAVQIGEAVTDANGSFEMYLAPATESP
jgi:hypothetical protein